MLEGIYQAWWRPYSALQFAVRSLSRAAENSPEKMAPVKLIKSYTAIKSNLYQKLFLNLFVNMFSFGVFVVLLQTKYL